MKFYRMLGSVLVFRIDRNYVVVVVVVEEGICYAMMKTIL
jgi:hypothetical protein